MGFWMLQECERAWRGRTSSMAELLAAAGRLPAFRSLIDVGDPCFALPGDMPARIARACRASGEAVPGDEAAVVRCLLDSMALAIATALGEAERCAARAVATVHVVGGGAGNRLLLELLAATCGREVVAGPVEASAVGNLLVQLEACGQLRGRSDMRQVLLRSVETIRIAPEPTLGRLAERARRRWDALCASESAALAPAPPPPTPRPPRAARSAHPGRPDA